MTFKRFAIALAIGGTLTLPAGAQRYDEQATLAAQRQALAKLGWMDGNWRGEAVTRTPLGEHRITQTERIGPFLGGTVKLLEGRGFGADGKVSFNAFGTISVNPATGKYTLHSYAQGRSGDFPLVPTNNGYVWEVAAPGGTIRYTATFAGGTWTEIGERVSADGAPLQFFKMTLRRFGDSTWPEAGALTPK